MRLREEEFYEQYHQHGGTTIIPTEIFNELYDDATEEIERLNNIINELEKYLWEERYNHQGEYVYTGKRKVEEVYTMILDKIKELKGSNKE